MAQRTYTNIVASDHARQHNGDVYNSVTISSNARVHLGNVYNISRHIEYASQDGLGLDSGTRPRSLKAFRIAIICALIDEFNAVDILLDEIWEGEEFRPKYPDQNTYRFGRLGGKPVALVNLPGMGKVSAATVAAHLHVSLPNIEIAFLVGICGGAPHDEKHTPIELGDVIVGTQVIQTDFGRLKDTGLERKSDVEDVLGRLPPRIRQRLAFLESWRSRKAVLNDMTATIESKLRDPEFAEMFAPPHQQRNENPRLSKTPKIFFGRMASSDAVIRSEAHRDDLIKKERILGFEMESAGTWDQLSTILVKSVCDYADSQKSKDWQPFAALAAAACARAMISRWLFPRSDDEDFTQNAQDRDDTRRQGQPRQKQPLPKRRVVNLPSFPMKFVERTAPLDFLRDSLVPGQDHARAALVGLGGMGKSRVAARFAQDFQDIHPDTHVLWVNSSDPYHFDEDFKKIARSLRIPGFENPSVDYIALIKTWLRSPDSGKWLIILDNADNRNFIFQTSNSSGFRFAVIDCIPDKDECCVLMTSRDSFAATSFVGWGKGNIFELLKMTDVEAVRLLCAGKLPSEHRRGTKVEAEQIVSRLDCIPLAIVQASAYIFKKGTMMFQKYLRKLEHEEETLLSKKDLEVPIPVLMTWGVSLQQIESTSSYAIELLSVMSFLDKGRIPAWILRAHQDDDNFDDAIDTLSTFSFIDVNRTEDSEISINMHHLVQVATRMWLRAKGHEISAFQNSLSCLAQHYPAATFKNWPSCHLLEPHVDSLEAFLQTREEVISNQAREDRAELLYNSICYKRETGLYQEAFRLAQSILPEVNNLYSEKSENSHAVKHTMVVLQLDQGNLVKAADAGEKLLQDQCNTFGSDSQHTLLTMRTLAMVYLQQDKLSEAEERCLAVVKVRVPDLNEIDKADSQALDALTTLAEIHEARATRQTLNIRKTVFQSGHHSHTAPIVFGALQILSPTTDRAEDLHLRILNVRRRTEAEDDPHIIDSEQDLAVTYNRQGRFQEAQKLLDHVISTRRTWLGSEHAKLITSLHNSAWSKWGTGQFKEALELEERILSQSMRADFRDARAISLYQRTILGLLWSLGHYRALEKEAKKAVDEHITWFSTVDERTICCMAVLAEAHERLYGSYPVPDYDLSVSEAYTQATRAILESTNDLHVLAHAEGWRSGNCPGMPSWVPDWSVKSKLGLGITGYRRFYAASTLLQEVEFADPGTKRILSLHAALVDEVAQIGETEACIHQEGSLRQCQQLLEAIGPVYATGQSTIEAFWRTLIQDTGPSIQCPADPGLSVGFSAWLKEAFANAGSIARLDRNVLNEEDVKIAASFSDYRKDIYGGNRRPTCPLEVAYEKRMPSKQSTTNKPEKVHTRSAYEQCFMQRLHLTVFRTTSGLLGSGSAKLQQSDSIWIVPGSRVPLILRERRANPVQDAEARYELIGGAYVHGIMHGEALDQIPCREANGDIDTTHLRFVSVEIE